MKYTILINQAGIHAAGLTKSTDLVDWAIIDYIQNWQCCPKAVFFRQHVWINLKNLISEMPLLGLNSKQSVSKRITKLKNLGIISCEYDDSSRLYCRITQETSDAVNFSSVNSELTGGQQRVDGGVNSELTGGQQRVDIQQTIREQTIREQTIREQINDAQSAIDNPKNTIDQTINDIFVFWKQTFNHEKSRLDSKRIQAIKKSLKIGYTVSDLKKAITGCSLTPWNNGEETGKKYDELTLILRDADHIDRFIRNADSPPPNTTANTEHEYTPIFSDTKLAHQNDIDGECEVLG